MTQIMASVFDIRTLLIVFKDVRHALTSRRNNIIKSHEAINHAFIRTYDYLRNNNGEYIPKPELAELWNRAASEVMLFDKNLGDTLFNKSRFWTDPDLYINLNRGDEIIELNQITDEMERLRMKLR